MNSNARVERSLRRSKHRARVLLVLAAGGEWRAGQISTKLGLPLGRVLWALHGHLPQYQPRLGLVRLGLVQARATPQGTLYRASTSGRALARVTLGAPAAPTDHTASPATGPAPDPWGPALATGSVVVWTTVAS